MPSARECADRLREQAYKTLSPQLEALNDELEQVRRSLAAGIGQLEQKIEALRRVELPAMAPALDGMLEESIRARDLESEALAQFTHDLGRMETQEQILSLLLDAAARCFARVALFALRDGRLTGWSSRGFAEDAARTIGADSFSPDACPEFGDALAGTAPVEASSLPEAPSLAAVQAGSRGPWRLQALRVLDRPVALLVAGEGDGVPARPQALSILVNFTALRLENIALRLLQEFREPAPAAPGDRIPGTREEPKPQAGPMEPPPLPPEPADQAPEPEAAPGAAPEEPGHEFGDWAGSGFEASAPPDRGEDSPAGEDEKLHADAKRFARLLVSEIKLYNETHVTEGRQNQDLYLRLKRDIDRSREMYEKRVSPTVADRIDYFHDEIVRILGDNDPSTLGSDYPGPRIES
ncbi:MAG: hypothetical protein JXP48_04950 [Acidobacteria bacterium]|nr:hypothetical protein [Acidobacteriota bacterium]